MYRRFHGLVTHKPIRFQKLDEFLAASGRPTSFEEIKWIRNKGIHAILSLIEKPLPEVWFKDAGWKYLCIQIRDHTTPTVDQLDTAITFIEEMRHHRIPVLVHCAAGIGRTGTVLAAYFIKIKGHSAKNAIDVVRHIRPGSIEETQEKAVYAYEVYLEGKSSKV